MNDASLQQLSTQAVEFWRSCTCYAAARGLNFGTVSTLFLLGPDEGRRFWRTRNALDAGVNLFPCFL